MFVAYTIGLTFCPCLEVESMVLTLEVKSVNVNITSFTGLD